VSVQPDENRPQYGTEDERRGERHEKRRPSSAQPLPRLRLAMKSREQGEVSQPNTERSGRAELRRSAHGTYDLQPAAMRAIAQS
jgi:hypothetical protein